MRIMKAYRSLFTAFCSLAFLLFTHAGARGASFTPLGLVPGGLPFTDASGISADGSVVIGRGFRWTIGGGAVYLGDLPGSSNTTMARGVSADGSVVVGTGGSAPNSEAFRWTISGGIVGLGDLPGGVFNSGASGVSADGSVVVGTSNSSSGNEAFRWTSAGGMVGLGSLSDGVFNTHANGISADGSVVVGLDLGTVPRQGFRWTSGGGMVGLGVLSGGDFSNAAGVSADGSVVVGAANSAAGGEAFRWTSGGGMVGLGDLPGGNVNSVARAVSADGSVVVGRGVSGLGEEAFIWDQTNGMRNLRTLLMTEFSLNLTGWSLKEATGISADGLKIVGNGVNPDGNQESWLADLTVASPVPEPSSLVLLGTAVVACCARGLRRRRWRARSAEPSAVVEPPLVQKPVNHRHGGGGGTGIRGLRAKVEPFRVRFGNLTKKIQIGRPVSRRMAIRLVSPCECARRPQRKIGFVIVIPTKNGPVR